AVTAGEEPQGQAAARSWDGGLKCPLPGHGAGLPRAAEGGQGDAGGAVPRSDGGPRPRRRRGPAGQGAEVRGGPRADARQVNAGDIGADQLTVTRSLLRPVEMLVQELVGPLAVDGVRADEPLNLAAVHHPQPRLVKVPYLGELEGDLLVNAD